MKKPCTAPTTIEDSLASSGIWPIAGVDEAGRGTLAGPVVACAIILPRGIVIDGVNDSKKTTVNQRIKLAAQIKKAAVAYAYGIVDVDTIEAINILQASLLAMRQALESLKTIPAMALIDGTAIPRDLFCNAQAVKHGDSASHLIAAASILAKVKRDSLMEELDEKFPIYGFAKHKGYGTAAHRDAILKNGLCSHHRPSFCKKVLSSANNVDI